MKKFGSRIRMKHLNLPKGQYGIPVPGPGKPAPVLGKYVIRQANGALLSSQEIQWTGAPKPSLFKRITIDELHPHFKRGKKTSKKLGDLGGPFASLTVRYPNAFPQGPFVVKSADGLKSYTGVFLQTESNVSPQYSLFDNTESVASAQGLFPDISSYHNLAWDLLKPKVEKTGMLQFLYELKDLPGMLRTSAKIFSDSWRSRQFLLDDLPNMHLSNELDFKRRWNAEFRPYMWPKQFGDHFLNHHFGWAPFVKDIVKFLDTALNYQRHLDQLTRDNGRWIRRGVVLSETRDDTILRRDYSCLTQPSPDNLNQLSELRTIDGQQCRGITDTRMIINTKIWAEGSFRFWRPEFDAASEDFFSVCKRIRRLISIFGLRVNPAVLWRITPWSWFVDWFTGIGRNISILNDSVLDQVAANHAYLMCHRNVRTLQTCIGFWQSGQLSLSWERSYETKYREPAGSPYGFNLPWNGLSSRQLGILGSLGITRTNFR
jgi:hypothetical protein